MVFALKKKQQITEIKIRGEIEDLTIKKKLEKETRKEKTNKQKGMILKIVKIFLALL